MQTLLATRLGGRALVLAVGVAVLLLAVALAVALARGVGGDDLGDTPAAFTVAPNFTLTTFDGRPLTLAEYKDAPVFLYFWASWCGPCEREAPLIQRLWPEYQAAGYVFIGVNTTDREREAVDFVQRLGLTFPLVRDRTGAEAVYLQYGVNGLPEAFFLRSGLALESRYVGALDEQQLRTHLDAIGRRP